VFFCGESVTGYDKADIRQVWIGREFDDLLHEAVKKHNNDNWSLQVLEYLECFNNLFAEDAVYHILCSSQFTQSLSHTPRKVPRGRPQNDVIGVHSLSCVIG